MNNWIVMIVFSHSYIMMLWSCDFYLGQIYFTTYLMGLFYCQQFCGSSCFIFPLILNIILVFVSAIYHVLSSYKLYTRNIMEVFLNIIAVNGIDNTEDFYYHLISTSPSALHSSEDTDRSKFRSFRHFPQIR